jgi:hypothetical protein
VIRVHPICLPVSLAMLDRTFERRGVSRRVIAVSASGREVCYVPTVDGRVGRANFCPTRLFLRLISGATTVKP